MFSNDQLVRLQAPLDESRVAVHPHTNRDYLQTWDCIRMANEIFGEDGWSYKLTHLQVTPFGYVAGVEVSIGTVIRNDVGFGDFAPKLGDASNVNASSYDTASKGAVSDALKRALRSFGPQFGNTLYDKRRVRGPSAMRPGPGPQQNYETPSAGYQPWEEWALTVEGTTPDEFNAVLDSIADDPRPRKVALVKEARARGVPFGRDSMRFVDPEPGGDADSTAGV